MHKNQNFNKTSDDSIQILKKERDLQVLEMLEIAEFGPQSTADVRIPQIPA